MASVWLRLPIRPRGRADLRRQLRRVTGCEWVAAAYWLSRSAWAIPTPTPSSLPRAEEPRCAGLRLPFPTGSVPALFVAILHTHSSFLAPVETQQTVSEMYG